MLTTWPSGFPAAVETTQEALLRLERWYLPLNPSKCEASFSVDFCQTNFCLAFPYSISSSASILLPFFLGSLLSFLFYPYILRLNSSFIRRPYAVFLVSHDSPSKSPLFFFTQVFFNPFSFMLHQNGFHFPALPSWNERLYQVAGGSIASCFWSSRMLFLLFEASLPFFLVTLNHLAPPCYQRALLLSSLYPVWVTTTTNCDCRFDEKFQLK